MHATSWMGDLQYGLRVTKKNAFARGTEPLFIQSMATRVASTCLLSNWRVPRLTIENLWLLLALQQRGRGFARD